MMTKKKKSTEYILNKKQKTKTKTKTKQNKTKKQKTKKKNHFERLPFKHLQVACHNCRVESLRTC